MTKLMNDLHIEFKIFSVRIVFHDIYNVNMFSWSTSYPNSIIIVIIFCKCWYMYYFLVCWYIDYDDV